MFMFCLLISYRRDVGDINEPTAGTRAAFQSVVRALISLTFTINKTKDIFSLGVPQLRHTFITVR